MHEQVPVLRNLREEDTAAKRLKLSEADDAENIVITDDRLEDAEEARVFLEREDNGSELKNCESCGEKVCLPWCARPTDDPGRREDVASVTETQREKTACAAEQRSKKRASEE